jgi:hypothetical protein
MDSYSIYVAALFSRLKSETTRSLTLYCDVPPIGRLNSIAVQMIPKPQEFQARTQRRTKVPSA